MNKALDTTREFEIVRILDAPKSLVLRMWSEADLMAKWWGPFGFSTTVNVMDFRPNGKTNYTMHGPDGFQVSHTMYYQETGPDRIVYEQNGLGQDADFLAVVTFESTEDGKTKQIFRLAFKDAETLRLMVEKYGAVKGHVEVFTRLDSYLADVQAEEAPFQMFLSLPSPTSIRTIRSLRAPKEIVFEAYTNPDLIRRWQGPRDLEFKECSFDANVGGRWTMSQFRPSSGESFSFRGEVLEIETPNRLVSTFQFDDWDPMVNEMTFEESNSVTRVTIVSSFKTTEDRDQMLNSGMEFGMKVGYERLQDIFDTTSKQD